MLLVILFFNNMVKKKRPAGISGRPLLLLIIFLNIIDIRTGRKVYMITGIKIVSAKITFTCAICAI